MDSTDRLNLQKMINANDVQDQTDLIREKKHSQLIMDGVQKLLEFKKNKANLELENKESFDQLCILTSSFLFTNYTDIFNKVKKDEISIDILFKFLDVLKKIEDGQLDQHEASFTVGKYLKELYVDSALKRADKFDKKTEEERKMEAEENVDEIKITWKEYKKRIEVQHAG